MSRMNLFLGRFTISQASEGKTIDKRAHSALQY